MSGFIAWLATRLLPVRAFLGKVPTWAWIALAIAVATAGGVWWHHGKVKAFGNERYAAGEAARDAEITALQTKLNAADAKIAADIREKNNEENRRIAGVADALRLSGPGRARATCVPASPGGHITAGGKPDAAGPQVPADDGAAVPWGWLVQRSEQADLNRAEVLSWREWYARFAAEWAKTGAGATKGR